MGLSARIGEAYGMLPAQVLKYLHAAKDAGLATPVHSDEGGIIRGWVPAAAGPAISVAEQKARRMADAIRELYAGKPLSVRAVARHLNANRTNLIRWLRKAAQLGLVHEADSGWTPA